MKNVWSTVVILCALLLTLSVNANGSVHKMGYPEIEWADLIPADDLEALLNPRVIIALL